MNNTSLPEESGNSGELKSEPFAYKQIVTDLYEDQTQIHNAFKMYQSEIAALQEELWDEAFEELDNMGMFHESIKKERLSKLFTIARKS